MSLRDEFETGFIESGFSREYVKRSQLDPNAYEREITRYAWDTYQSATERALRIVRKHLESSKKIREQGQERDYDRQLRAEILALERIERRLKGDDNG